MQYKTIVLQLLEQQPELYNQLRNRRQLLPALETYSDQLKTLHEREMETLAEARPGSDPIQISSEALETALKEFEDRLPTAPSIIGTGTKPCRSTRQWHTSESPRRASKLVTATAEPV